MNDVCYFGSQSACGETLQKNIFFYVNVFKQTGGGAHLNYQ